MLTSRLMKLQGDVGIKAQTEVVVEDIQGQLEECQGVEMTAVTHKCQLFPRPRSAPTALAQSTTFRGLCVKQTELQSPQHCLGDPAPAAGKGDGSSSEDLLGPYNTVSPDVIYCINFRNRGSSIAAA